MRRPDIARARSILGWEPKVSREEGLRLTLEYFRQRLGLTGENTPKAGGADRQ